MNFNGDANTMDLCGLADRLVKTDDVDFPLSDKALYANWGSREIAREIYKSYGGLTFQDSNVAGVDEVTQTLLNDGTRFYPFVTIAAIAGMEYMDENGTKFKLEPITLEQIQEMGYAEAEFCKTPSTPRYYRPVKNGVNIYPAWSTTKAAVANGLIGKIRSQDISPFTAASTSTAPGYDSLAGHEAVAAFMAQKYASINVLDCFEQRYAEWITGISGVKSHYAKKFAEMKVAIRKQGRGGDYASQFS